MGSDPPVILFDGVCNLCNGAIVFIIRRDKKGVFRFAPLQSEFGKKTLAGIDVVTDSIILTDAAGTWQKSNAVLRIARQLSGLWPALYVFKIFPRVVRDAVYDWVARNRYRLFGKKDVCMIPTPELKARFLSE